MIQGTLFETSITLPELSSHLWEAANILRGSPVDRTDWKSYILPLLFFKRICDVWDEERQTMIDDYGEHFPDEHRFQIPEGSHWQDVREASSNVGTALQNALRNIEVANQKHLYGVFGDAQWTNKEKLSDQLLKDLIEHFSALNLSNKRVHSHVMGDAYEYLIKKFADTTKNKAGEFYTPRSVVHLIVDMLDPQEGETVYDPACGTGGMLLAAVTHLRNKGGDARTFFGKLYGQEKNLTTASIARMNLVLHGVDDYQVMRGDTLENPAFSEDDQLKTFDVVLANPPYSIKQWNREKFQSDPWQRNFLGTPPQGRADYAFFQHILKSLDAKTGRCAILFPHGVLFRKEEAEMRKKLIEADLVECVLGLGANLFYNSPMEACILICCTRKPPKRQGQILFIDAVHEVARVQGQSFLKPEHQSRILSAYQSYSNDPGFATVATLEEIAAQDYSLSIPLYVRRKTANSQTEDLKTLAEVWADWEQGSRAFWQEMDALVDMLDSL
ncbi:SAM-dependent DNA methyltransferase [Aulosira sp. FACHB-113]|nr:SAM-dependent DNA methyltransferase [Aulosira sp. FACHB-113]